MLCPRQARLLPYDTRDGLIASAHCIPPQILWQDIRLSHKHIATASLHQIQMQDAASYEKNDFFPKQINQTRKQSVNLAMVMRPAMSLFYI
jgi:hypothetical protein